MKKNKSSAGVRVFAELDRIRIKHGGILVPEDVVRAARPESSPLHNQFEWSDTAAAREYRLWQARRLISVAVTVLEPTSGSEVRAFVSLRHDRQKEHGGYRAIADVMSSDRLRAQLLEEAKADMLTFRNRYASLEELSSVFRAMGRALKTSGRSAKSVRKVLVTA